VKHTLIPCDEDNTVTVSTAQQDTKNYVFEVNRGYDCDGCMAFLLEIKIPSHMKQVISQQLGFPYFLVDQLVLCIGGQVIIKLTGLQLYLLHMMSSNKTQYVEAAKQGILRVELLDYILLRSLPYHNVQVHINISNHILLLYMADCDKALYPLLADFPLELIDIVGEYSRFDIQCAGRFDMITVSGETKIPDNSEFLTLIEQYSTATFEAATNTINLDHIAGIFTLQVFIVYEHPTIPFHFYSNAVKSANILVDGKEYHTLDATKFNSHTSSFTFNTFDKLPDLIPDTTSTNITILMRQQHCLNCLLQHPVLHIQRADHIPPDAKLHVFKRNFNYLRYRSGLGGIVWSH